MKKKIFNCVLSSMAFFLLLSMGGCGKKDADATGVGTGNSAAVVIDSTYTSGTAEGSTETGADEDDLLENSTFSTTVSIRFGTTLTIDNPLSAKGVTITTNGDNVTINSTAKAVVYSLSGTTTNGSVKIYSDNKFELLLNGTSIASTSGPAINIQSHKRVFVVLADNTDNILTDGTTYAAAPNDEDQKAAFFSEGQLIFSGNGNLSVKGNYKHAICSDDYVRIQSGSISVTGSVSDGIHTNDAFIQDGGLLSITSGSDGIECDEGHIIINGGSTTINAADDGITASYEGTDATILPYVTINDGTISIQTKEGEGIESKSELTINKGTITTITADDGLNGGTAIYINGGHIYSYSTGNDAMDSNGIFTITGGIIVAIGARAPEAGIDCDARTLKITGGITVATGGATSGPTASVSTVHSVIMGAGTANQIIHIESADGAEVLSFLVPVSYSTLLFASSRLQANTTYKVYTGGSVSAATDFYGLYTSGTYSGGTSSTSFTTSNMVTQIGGTISRN